SAATAAAAATRAAAEAAASTAAAITAAKAATVTAAAAKPVAAAIVAERIMRSEIRRRAAAEAVETLFPETVALVLPAAAPFVVTHNSNNTLSCSPQSEVTGTENCILFRRGRAQNPPSGNHHSVKDSCARMI
ncbi:MAG: hypothetical protein ACJAUS_001557, partial [Qipengyuania sp.]